MKIRPAACAAFALIVAATPAALSQQSGPTGAPDTILVEIENEDLVFEPFNMLVSELDDLSVVDVTGESIGEVDEILGSPEGEIIAVAVEVGGFLGIGTRKAIVPLDQLTFMVDDRELVMDMTREEVETLPAWDNGD